jgi:hypothetical protein
VRRQQVSNTPAMLGDAGGHGRCPRHTPHASPRGGEAQTRMRRAEIIDRPNQIHPMLQRQCAPCQCAPSTRQRCQACTECGVEPLNVRRVHDPIALRTAPQHLDTCWRPSNDTALHLDHTPRLMVRHNLCHTDVAPRAQPRTPVRPQSHRITKRLEDGPDIGAQPVGTKQERPDSPGFSGKISTH